MVWYGRVWYGMVWYGVWDMGYGMVWCGMVCYGMVDASSIHFHLTDTMRVCLMMFTSLCLLQPHGPHGYDPARMHHFASSPAATQPSWPRPCSYASLRFASCSHVAFKHLLCKALFEQIPTHGLQPTMNNMAVQWFPLDSIRTRL